MYEERGKRWKIRVKWNLVVVKEVKFKYKKKEIYNSIVSSLVERKIFKGKVKR